MKIKKNAISRSVVAALSMAAATLCIDAHADIVYNSLPTIVNPPTNTNPSYPYAATGTTEIGDHITLAGTSRLLQSVTVQMSDYAIATNYPTSSVTVGGIAGYFQALTLNLYNYTGATAGAAIGSETFNAFVPFRPAENAAACAMSSGQYGYLDSTNTCRNAVAFNATFNFSALNLALPSDFVFGLAFAPAGPSQQLNFTTATGVATGTDASGADAIFSRTGSGAFAQTSGEAPYGILAVQFNANATSAVPEPSSIALLGIAGAGLLVARRRRAAR